MVRIAVVDEEKIMSEIIYYRVKNVMYYQRQDYILNTFTSGKELLEEHEADPFDLVFLDIDMPEITGLQIAQKLRDRDSNIEIVFVTNKSELVYESFKYTPFRFIRKTRMDYEIEETITSFLAKREKSKVTYVFSLKEGKKTVTLTDIIYIEAHSHKLSVFMSGSYFVANGNMKDIEKSISEFGFIRVHQSFLVNYRYIFFVKPKEIILDNGNSLPISRGKVEIVQEELMRFLKEK